MTKNQLLYEYFINISDRAKIDVDRIRENRYLYRDEVELLEEIIALNTQKVIEQIFIDVRAILKSNKNNAIIKLDKK